MCLVERKHSSWLISYLFLLLNSYFISLVYSQSETKLYNGSDKDVSASGGKLTKKESLKVSELKPA